MKPFNQFDMEQQIMTCWNICEDLETLNQGVLDRGMTTDQIANVLLGLKDLYQLKFETLFEQFEAMLHEKREDKFHKLWSSSETTNYDRDDDNMGYQPPTKGEYLVDGE